LILPDVNVLVHAFRADSSNHGPCRAWLETVVGGEPRFGIAPQVLSVLLRVVTHHRIFVQPSPFSEALAFCDALLGQSHCVVVQAGARHWPIFVELCRAADARGNLVADAWFAALAIEWGCEWITLDRDYARFPGLRWRPPADDEGRGRLR